MVKVDSSQFVEVLLFFTSRYKLHNYLAKTGKKITIKCHLHSTDITECDVATPVFGATLPLATGKTSFCDTYICLIYS